MPFVAPVSGVVYEVNTQNRWTPSTDRGADREGRFVTVIGDDGVRYLGGHLGRGRPGDSSPDVRVQRGPGPRPGRQLRQRPLHRRPTCTSRSPGRPTPSLWWVRRGMVNAVGLPRRLAEGQRHAGPPTDEVRAVMNRTGSHARRCDEPVRVQDRPSASRRRGRRSPSAGHAEPPDHAERLSRAPSGRRTAQPGAGRNVARPGRHGPSVLTAEDRPPPERRTAGNRGGPGPQRPERCRCAGRPPRCR